MSLSVLSHRIHSSYGVHTYMDRARQGDYDFSAIEQLASRGDNFKRLKPSPG